MITLVYITYLHLLALRSEVCDTVADFARQFQNHSCVPMADKCYALAWYHVCPVAWLRITKLCPCLSYFPGFIAILKV